MSQLDLIATSSFGLEAVVARELTALGYESKTIQPGRMLFHGDASAICRVNLWLRAADRVLLRVGTFSATDFGALFDQTFALPWDEWLPATAAFPVTGRSLKSQLSSVPACQKIVKKAIVEKLRQAHHVESLDETGPKYSIEVALLEDQATLTIDTSGPGLHKRGYRRLVGPAPLRETLAAGLILLSFWRPDRPLVDPFCGSGTIPIEAALIGRNLAPGLQRSFAAEAWPNCPASLWDAARQEARDLARPSLPQRAIGTDADEESLSLARYHAEQAGVADDVHFQQKRFADFTSKREYGCVISNPPYGERLGRQAEIEALYRTMPEVFRRLKTWSFYVLTAHPDFEALLGQSADRRRKLYNGPIQCTYYQYFGPKPRTAKPTREDRAPLVPSTPADGLAPDMDERNSAAVAGGSPGPGLEQPSDTSEGYSPDSAGHRSAGVQGDSSIFVDTKTEAAPPPATPERPRQSQGSAGRKPAFGGLSAKAHEQADLFRRRLIKRARHLRRWPTRLGITCYRLYERDIPEIPLIADRYEDCLHMAEFERPHDRTPAEHGDWLDLLERTASETLEVPRENVFLKRHRRQRGDWQYQRVAQHGRVLIVHEGGLRFEVNLSDYLDTGLFLDHRVTRSMVREESAGKRFLNLFGYTGSFSVYAAAGGAASTVTVDWSNTYLEWAERNLRLNGFDGPEHALVRADAVGFLHGLPRRPKFDLAVVDPPTFSNSKRTEDFWDVQRDHAGLLAQLLERMEPGGVVYFSTNFRRFKLDDGHMRGAAVREISRQTVPPDFRNRRIHRCWRIVKDSI